jgi:hypothetical protein
MIVGVGEMHIFEHTIFVTKRALCFAFRSWNRWLKMIVVLVYLAREVRVRVRVRVLGSGLKLGLGLGLHVRVRVSMQPR